MINLSNVSYAYQKDSPLTTKALSEIDLTIEKGEFIGLIGHTGSGKTTLCHLIAGLIAPTGGCYTAFGITSPKTEQLKGRIGLVFQYPEHQLFEETVFDDIAFGPTNLGLSEATVKERVEASLKYVGLESSILQESPFELSGGQKRRVAIAGVLAMAPEFLILDEPTAGLDPAGRSDILRQIKILHEEMGATVVLVSHNMEDIVEYAEHVVVMKSGEIYIQGSVSQVFKSHKDLMQIGLALPQISNLSLKLKQKDIDLGDEIFTVAQAFDAILAEYRKRKRI